MYMSKAINDSWYGNVVTNDIAQQFVIMYSAFFSSILKDSHPLINNMNLTQLYIYGNKAYTVYIETLASIQIRSTDEVETKRLHLDPRKSPWQYLSPLKRSKRLWTHITSKYLRVYFNALPQNGTFSQHFKSSFIIPIYKWGGRHDIKNYRHIAIQSTLAKVDDPFESLVFDQLSSALKNK